MSLLKFPKIMAALALGVVISAGAAGQAQAQVSNCTTNSDGEITDVGACYLEPDYYGITVYQMMLCSSAPSPADTSMCQEVFSNDSGSLVSVERGELSTPEGDLTRPAPNTYTHGVMVFDAEFNIRTTATFSAAMNGKDGTSGKVCWTVDGTVTGLNSNPAVYPGATYVDNGDDSTWFAECGASAPATPGTIVDVLNTFDPGSFVNTASEVVGGNTMTATLLDGAGAVAAAGADVRRVFGVVAFSTPVLVTDESSLMDVQLQTSKGSTAILGGGNLTQFSSGPFGMKIEVE